MSRFRPHRPDNITFRHDRHSGCGGPMPSPGDRAGVGADSEGGGFVGRALVLERATRERSDPT
jgi:hypothetical protein